jgi:hypothetical protein
MKSAAVFVLSLLAVPALAKPKSVTILKPCEELYKTALVKAGHDGYAVIEQDEKARTFRLKPPHGGIVFHAYTVSFFDEAKGQACRIEGDGHGSSNESRFLKQLSEEN